MLLAAGRASVEGRRVTAPWAEARVEAELDFGNIDTELRTRLTAAVQLASREVQREFDQIQRRASLRAGQTAREWENAFQRIRVAAQRTSTALANGLKAEVKVDLDQASVNAARARLNQAFADALNVKLEVNNGDITSMATAIRTAHAKLQQWLDANPLKVRMDVDTSSLQGDLRAAHSALQAWLLSNPLRVRVDVDQNGISRLTRSMSGSGNNSLLGALSKVGSKALDVTKTVAKFGAIAGAATVGIAGSLPTVVALGAAIASVGAAGAGAGVAGMTAMIAAAATLKVAFSGVGDALTNAFDPANAEKFNEAMAKLSPQAQGFVKAIQGINKAWKDSGAQLAVQDSLFAGLGAKISTLGTQMMPAVRASMLTVADGFNEGANSALRFANSTTGVATLQDILAGSSNMAANFGAALGNLVPGLAAIGAGAATAFSPLTDGIGGATRSLSTMLVEANNSGQISRFFLDAVEVARQFGAVLQQVGGILAAVGSAAAEVGNGNALGGLTDRLREVNAFFSAGEGRAALVGYFGAMQAAVGSILPILMNVAGIIGTTIAPAIAGLITQIAPAINHLIGMIGVGLNSIAPAMAPLGAAINSIAGALAPVMPILGQIIAQVVQILGPIIGSLATALSPVLQAIGQGLLTALQQLQPAVAPIQSLFAALSPIIAQVAVILGQTLSAALGVLVPVFVALANAVTFVLPVIQGLVQMLQPFGPVIGAVAAAVLVAVGAFKAFQVVTSIIKGVQVAWMLLNLAFTASPIGLIIVAIAALAAGLALFFTKTETGRRIWDAIWNGIKATFSAVWNGIKAAWDAVWPVLESGLRAIGAVVGWVADHWKILLAVLTGPIGIIIGLALKFGILQAAFRAVGTAATWLWQNAIQPAFSVIGSIISGVWAVVRLVFQGWVTIFQAVGGAVMWFWNTVISPAFAAIGAIISAWWGVVSGVFNFFVGLLTTIAGAVAGFVTSAIGWFANLASTVWGTISGWVSNMWGAISGFVSNVIGAISGFVGQVIGFFDSLASSVIGSVTNLWNTVRDGFTNGIATAVNLVTGMKDKIVGFFSSAGSWLVNAGKSIIQGIVDGIQSMAGAIGNAILNMIPSSVRGAVSSALGLWVGGMIPAYRNGGLMQLARFAGGGQQGSTQNVGQPGSFIVNANATRRNLGLLRRIAPHGKQLSGPGNGTSDSITAVWGGRARARVSRDEYWVPPGDVAGILPILLAINSGANVMRGALADGFAGGGVIGDVLAAAKNIVNSGYVWGGWGNGWNTDCSGAASSIANLAVGKGDPGTGERTATGGMGAFLQARGFLSGMGGPNDVSIGWSDTHAASTIAGTNVEHTGPEGTPGKYGGDASGADSLPNQMHLPMEGDPSGTAGAVPSTGTPSMGSSTPIGSGISSSGGSASWGNSGGGSKYNSADDAKKAGVTPVWVENWPASMGGGSTSTVPTTTPVDTATPSATASSVDTIPLQQNPDGTWTSTDPEWAKLIKRESGGDPDIVQQVQDANSGGNEASGLFQIALGTWKANGGEKYAPSAGEATPQQQAEIAAKIFNENGGSPWGSGAGQNFGREDEEKLRAGIQRAGAVPTTPEGTVPVTVTNPEATPQTTVTPTTETPTPTTVTPSTVTPSATPATTTQQDRFKVDSTISGTAGGYTDNALQQGIDAFLKDHPGLLGSWDNSTATTSLGKRAGSVASTALGGQLSSALGIFGLDSTPTLLQSISQYDQDNRKQGTDAATKKDLIDLAQAIWQGNINITINGNADGQDVVNQVDAERRRKMRRYVK